MSSKQEWPGTTYGSSWMHRWLIKMLKHIDPRAIYVFVAIFVVPVCLLVNPGQKVIYHYFRKIWKYSPWRSFLLTYKNFYLFGQVVVDKFAMYAGKKFDIDIEGYERFLHLVEQSDGFLQLSAHIGNYEIAGYSLVAKQKKFNALVFGGEKASVMENRNKMFDGTNIHMIGVKDDMSHLFEINTALERGEIVSMPADRFVGSAKFIPLSFLGVTAHFPMGPFSVAVSRSLQVLAVNVMKTSAEGYKIYVTPLRYDSQAAKTTQIRQLAQSYVDELERVLKLYPEQWYNYYEFWNNGSN